jgi:predicted nuclease of predicted toxin-antitoxin system
MRLLFDQNLSHRLVTLLASEYPGSVHVRDVGLNAADDQVIWQFAAQQGDGRIRVDPDR